MTLNLNVQQTPPPPSPSLARLQLILYPSLAPPRLCTPSFYVANSSIFCPNKKAKPTPARYSHRSKEDYKTAAPHRAWPVSGPQEC